MKIKISNKFIGKSQKSEAAEEVETQKPVEVVTGSGKVEKELALGKNMSIIRFVDALVERGQELRASDIHLDPENDVVRIRFRIDGVLQDLYQVPKELQDGVISRI